MRLYKKRAPTPKYVSPNQLVFEGFETPFEQKLDNTNRWMVLSGKIPLDKIVGIYDRQFHSLEGRAPISGRVVLGSLMIKHLGNLSDRETIAQIRENMYMQYFLGYTSFTTAAPFAASLFVEVRKRLSGEILGQINEIIALHAIQSEHDNNKNDNSQDEQQIIDDQPGDNIPDRPPKRPAANDKSPQIDTSGEPPIENSGKLLMDATVAPQNIT